MRKTKRMHLNKTQRNMRRTPYINITRNFSWDAMNKKLLMGLGMLCMATWSMQAQEEDKKGNLGTEVVNIVQSYKPSISKSNKQSMRPDVSNIQDAERKSVDYSIFSVPVASTFQPEKGSAANLKRARKPKYFNNYARLGFGNYTNANAELFSNFDIGQNDNFAAFLSHNSSQGGIKGVEIDDKYYRTNLDLEYTTKGRDWDMAIRGGIEHQLYNWYGMPSPKPNLSNPEALFKSNDQTYFSGYLGGTIGVGNSFFKQADLDMRLLTDSHSSSEIMIQTNPEFIVPINDMDIRIGTDIAYLDGSFKNQYQSNANGNNYGFFHAGILPSLTYVDEDLAFVLGAKGYVLSDTDASETKFKIYPDVHASYKLVDEFMTLYGSATGGLQQNSFYSLKEDNPFVSPTLLIKPTSTTYKVAGGIKGKFTSAIGYKFEASYGEERDRALFALNDYEQSNTYNRGYEKAHSFNVLYDKVNTLTIEGEVLADVSDELQLGLYAAFHSYDTSEEVEAWNLPELETSLFANYKITDKIYTRASIFFVGERKDRVFRPGTILQPDTYDTVKLKSFVDANLQVSYQFTPQLSFFAKGDNLVGGAYKKWYAYPMQDIQFMLGATYQFDWQ